MAPRIFVLAGGTGSGKTTLLNLVCQSSGAIAVIPPKYSNRESRGPGDDVVHVDDDINSSEYAFAYSMQDNFYGFKLTDIIEPLKQGKNVFLVLSDMRVIEGLRAFFGNFVSVIYLFRNMSEDEFEQIMEARRRRLGQAERKSVSIRRNRLYLIQRQYIENIALFDHVLINRGGRDGEMLTQMVNIIEGDRCGGCQNRHRGPVIFLIAAASGAGKRTLMQAMYSLGSKSITVIPKETDRPVQPEDGKEIIAGMSDLQRKYRIHYVFDGKQYAVNDSLIWDNLKAGLPQIVITNMQQFDRFQEIFGKTTVSVYVHATRTKDEIFEHQKRKLGDAKKARAKVEKLEKVHQDYIANIAGFQHVLLNTIEKEDLWDQMFRLIKFYNP